MRELLERNWQAGDEWIVAGVSMGGLGAMTQAARHPELFELVRLEVSTEPWVI